MENSPNEYQQQQQHKINLKILIPIKQPSPIHNQIQSQSQSDIAIINKDLYKINIYIDAGENLHFVKEYMQWIGFVREGSTGGFRGYGLEVGVAEVEVRKEGRVVWYLQQYGQGKQQWYQEDKLINENQQITNIQPLKNEYQESCCGIM